MRGIIPTIVCAVRGCDHSGSACSRCGRLDANREKLLAKTIQRNRMLLQENKSHMERIRVLKRKIKSGKI